MTDPASCGYSQARYDLTHRTLSQPVDYVTLTQRATNPDSSKSDILWVDRAGPTLMMGTVVVGGGGGGSASALKTTGADVVVSTAAPPAIGRILYATSATAAAWRSIGISEISTDNSYTQSTTMSTDVPLATSGTQSAWTIPTLTMWDYPSLGQLRYIGIPQINVQFLATGSCKCAGQVDLIWAIKVNGVIKTIFEQTLPAGINTNFSFSKCMFMNTNDVATLTVNNATNSANLTNMHYVMSTKILTG